MNSIPEKQYNYFYKTTNLLNGKFYYGIHSTDRLNDGYKGSGKVIKAAFLKYGKSNFQKEIIAFYPTRKEASDHEALIVTEELINDDMCYNCVGGGNNSYIISEETRKKLIKAKSGDNAPRLGAIVTESTRKKISVALKDRYKIYPQQPPSEETRKKISESKLGEKHPLYGKKLPPEYRQKISDAMKKHHLPHLEKFKKKCMIDSVIYESMAAAGRNLNVSADMVAYKIKSNNPIYENWKFI